MVLRDSGSNMVKACNDWCLSHNPDLDMPHFPCIGHSLHLVVGPFLLEKKKKSNESDLSKMEVQDSYDKNVANESGIFTTEEQDANDEDVTIDSEQYVYCENSDDVGDDIYCDGFTEFYDDEVLKRVREIVFKIRKLVISIKNLEDLHENILQVTLDIRTRWNSTLMMLICSLEFKEQINKFLDFYNTPGCQNEFKKVKTKLGIINERGWTIMQGLCHLLGSFELATKFSSSEKYSLFVTAFPVLRCIKNKIGDEKLFQFVNKSSIEKSDFKSEFYGQYGNTDFFLSAIRDLNSCRRLLFGEFIGQFKEMKI